MPAISKKILREFSDKEFRDEYVEARTRNLIAYQIRALRDQRNLSQTELAKLLPGSTQSTVSRAEDPDYGRLGVTSLLEFASAFDVAIIIKFCNHEDFLLQTADLSPANLGALSYEKNRVVTKVEDHQRSGAVPASPLVYTGAEVQNHGRFLGYYQGSELKTPPIKVTP